MALSDARVKDFLEESREGLEALDRDLVTLETDPTSVEVLSRVFRVIHTIKGTCGFFGFSALAASAILSARRSPRSRAGPSGAAPSSSV